MSTNNSKTFETYTCFRCQGSGRYSFNLMDGSVCYGCGGTGKKLTKRGAEAKRYLDQICTLPLEEIKVGDKVLWGGFTNGGKSHKYWAVVTEVDAAAKTIRVKSKYGESGGNGFATARRQATPEQIAQAIEYQATLTKAGTPRKRSA